MARFSTEPPVETSTLPQSARFSGGVSDWPLPSPQACFLFRSQEEDFFKGEA